MFFASPLNRCWISLALTICVFQAFGGGIHAEDGVPNQTATDEAAVDPAAVDYYERHIRPVLASQCYDCHSAQASDLKAGLRLDTRTGWMAGGDSGAAVNPASPDESLLLKAVQHAADVSPMPPEKEKLTDEVVEHFRHWIATGAPGGTSVSLETTSPSSSVLHWAFQRPVAPAIPRTDTDWSLAPLDRFIEQGLHEQRLVPSSAADRATFARRVFLDLTGLPPTYDEIMAFARSRDANAHERLIERLLASPRFGERWGRFWLDIARYADTKGYVFQEDRNYPEAFHYREWVIRSWNQDRPYDEFIQYQLAADQLAGDDGRELAAMGFLTLGRRFLNNRHDIIDDRIDVVSRGLLGMTVSCARCHSHKFDPIPIEDYYSLYGVFASSEEPGGAPSALRMVDRSEAFNPVVFIRGNPDRPGEAVPRQFLGVLAGPDRKPFERGSGRLELAQAIANRDNPLTARVMVNRVWGRLMGQYLVDTPSDFGTRSAAPKHVALLDHLAVEFMEHDWSVKWLVREIVRSATYRQSSLASSDAINADPTNIFFGRMNRRRLDFEGLRDSILKCSGLLRDELIGGPSVDINNADTAPRRTVYAFVDRQNVPGLFRVFDVASSDTHSPKRYETTVPQQALFLLNSPFAWSAAKHLGQAARQVPGSTEDQVDWIYRRVLARRPTRWEQKRAVEFLGPSEVSSPANAESLSARWNELAQALLVCNEFVYLD